MVIYGLTNPKKNKTNQQFQMLNDVMRVNVLKTNYVSAVLLELIKLGLVRMILQKMELYIINTSIKNDLH